MSKIRLIKNINGIKLLKYFYSRDNRGNFSKIFSSELFYKLDFKNKVAQINLSSNIKKGTIRGFHYQKNPKNEQKIIICIRGRILDVLIDIRKKSPTYGQWFGEYLSSKNRKQLFIPAGFAHGYCVTSNIAKVLYKCNDYYYSDDQYGIIWNDITLNINWPIKNPILSEKDIKLSSFQKKMK